MHIARIVHALRGMGHEVDVLSPPGIDPMEGSTGESTRAEAGPKFSRTANLLKWIAARLPGSIFELAEIAYNLPAGVRLAKALSKTRYDLVYERYAFYLVIGSIMAKRARVPFVLEANEVSGVELRNRRQHFSRLCKVFERKLFASCTAIHTVSSYLGTRIVSQGISPEKVHVTPNAFDIDNLPQHLNRDQIRQALGLNDKTVVGFAGWFSEWDRLDFLIEVFKSMSESYPQTSLLLIGDGPMVPGLKDKCRRLQLEGRVIFSGPVPRADVYHYISALDIAILPHSTRFGSPMEMFEFMGLSIPIVAPRLEPILDVQLDGETALLFTPLDADSCQAAIEELVRDPIKAKRLATCAHKMLKARHSWSNNASGILKSAGLH